MAFVGHRRETIDGPPVEIDCPACGAGGVTGTPRQYDETLLALGLIPIYRQRLVFIRCDACGRSSTSAASDLDAFTRLDPAARSASLRAYASGVGRFFVIAALVLFWFPFIAPPLALVGMLMTWRHPRWRKLGIIALGSSLLVAVAVALLILLND